MGLTIGIRYQLILSVDSLQLNNKKMSILRYQCMEYRKLNDNSFLDGNDVNTRMELVNEKVFFIF